MKKILLSVFFVATLASAPAFAEGYAAPGSFAVLGGLGYGSGLGFYGGAEFGILPLNLGGVLNFNISGRAVGSWTGYNLGGWNYSVIGIGGYGAAHWAFKNLGTGNEILDKLDYFLGLGLGVNLSSWNYDLLGTKYNESQTYYGFGYTSGFSYYFTDKLALSLEYNGLIGSSVGVIFQF